jgi:L-ascorbate metabolism protein UlaG (beta-lactamase superfamily)
VIAPALADDAFLDDLARAEAEEPEALHLWWLGQSGFLLAWAGRRALLDPYLSDSLTRKYAATDQPHVRMTARVVDPARLERVDLVTASHGHTDHLDAETLQAVLRASPRATLVVPEAHRLLAAERSGRGPERIVGVDDGTRAEARGLTVTAVPAAHERIERDGDGRMLHLGYVIGLGPWRVYHSGDTVRYDGMAERLRPHAVDVALLPVNGRDPARGVVGNLDGSEAARLAHDAGVDLAVPCHFEMFEFNTASPDAFVAECERLGQAHRVLRAAERLSLGLPG